ncbi:MAG: acetamidase/formamidase family protein [Puniceicoccaceae bacterium]
MTLRLDRSTTLNAWDNSVPPRLTIAPGDVVEIEMADSSDGQVFPGMSVEQFTQIDFEKIHALTGPIAVEGAQAGDTLKIEILSYQHEGWAWQSVNPQRCFLPEDFHQFHLRHWELDHLTSTSMPGIRLALDPFCGIIGGQRAEPGSFRTRPPGSFGGNLDVRHLVEGSTLFLPVEFPGALLCAGDAHAAQGHGEVSINGLEAPMTVRLKISLSKDFQTTEPVVLTTNRLAPQPYLEQPWIGFISSGPDLLECARNAVRRAIDYLGKRVNLSPEDAFLVCSAALDLKLSQVVNLPNYTVTGYLPEAIFQN